MERPAWGVYDPVRTLPKEPRTLFHWQASVLYEQFRENRLTVILIPAPRPRHFCHKIRLVTNHNPAWYKSLVESYRHLRRYLALPALEALEHGSDQAYDPDSAPFPKYHYHAVFRDLILERLLYGHQDYMTGEWNQPEPAVRDFFQGRSSLEYRLAELSVPPARKRKFLIS